LSLLELRCKNKVILHLVSWQKDQVAQEFLMKKMNMSHVDKLIRFAIGSILLAGVFAYPMSIWIKAACVGFGGVLWGTAFIRYCPLYNALRISTKGNKPSDD
jgi:hypothetical protein